MSERRPHHVAKRRTNAHAGLIAMPESDLPPAMPPQSSSGRERMFENTPLHDVTLWVDIYIFSFALILSVALILAGTV